MAAAPPLIVLVPQSQKAEATHLGTPIPDLTVNSAKRIPALDGLRGLAILLVLLCHGIFEWQPASPLLSRSLVAGRLAWSGVDLFFVLSGFLIGGILLDASQSPRLFKTFYIRRACRILPLYAMILLLSFLRFLTPHGSAGPLGAFSNNPIPWFSYLTFTQNLWMAGLGTFGVGTLAATWSLAVEEQFYLTAPWLIRRLSREGLTVTLLLVVVTAPLVRTAFHWWLPTGNFADYVLMPCRADALSWGVLAAMAVRSPKLWGYLLTRQASLRWILAGLFAGLVPLTLRGNEFSTVMVTAGYSYLAVFYAVLLLVAITGASEVVGRICCSKIMMELGTLAYAIYLIHLPAMEASRRILGVRFRYSAPWIQFAGGMLGILLTLLVARASWRFLEQPLVRRGHSYRY